MMMNKNKNKKMEEREWIEEKKLELRLGPPDDADWPTNKNTNTNNNNQKDTTFCSCLNTSSANKRGFKDHPFSANGGHKINNTYYHHHHLQQQSSNSKDSSHYCCCSTTPTTTTTAVDLQAPAPTPPAAPAAPAALHKRSGPPAPPVVGWPPVRSFRRNLAGSSTSSSLNPNHNGGGVFNKISNEKQQLENHKGLFVKINMDGVPIGRKVDLKVYDSYDKLSSAVDDLFRGLLAAQGDTLAGCGTKIMKGEGEKLISGELDGSGEYALVYEDNEGDRMLVGDVPWQMFISTVKRLRVLKTADISLHCKGSKAKELRT